jgi:hypothetical protein
LSRSIQAIFFGKLSSAGDRATLRDWAIPVPLLTDRS